jgi:hypothetical protein
MRLPACIPLEGPSSLHYDYDTDNSDMGLEGGRDDPPNIAKTDVGRLSRYSYLTDWAHRSSSQFWYRARLCLPSRYPHDGDSLS